jgi:CRP/FNR family transcriptional regulator
MASRGSSNPKSGITTWYLKRLPLFSRAAPTTIEALSSRLHTSEYSKKALVFTPGRELTHTYFLLRGSVKISRIEASDGKELILYMVRPGEPFGALPFMKGRDNRRIAVAHQKSLIGVLSKKDWEKISSADEAVYRSVMEVTASRLQQLQGRMAEIAYCDVNCRVARLLIRLSEEYPTERDCGTQIRLPFTQQDISDFIAATREMTSLTINEFKRKGWIAVHNRRICIHKIRSLQKIAE